MAIEQLIQSVLSATPSKRRELENVLNGKSASKSEAKTETRLVTISAAAKLLDIGRNTVYSLIEDGRLDTVELSGVKRVTYRSILEFSNGERPANNATEKRIQQSKKRYADHAAAK